MWLLAGLVGTAGAACDTILGIHPPPAPQDAGAGGKGAGGMPGTGSLVSATTTTTGAGGNPAQCAALDAGLGPDATVAPGTYFPLSPITVGDGGTWDFFKSPFNYYGGTFDGRYVYFAGRGANITQYDTQGAGFDATGSWVNFDVTTKLDAPGGFSGAVYDGRYVYFIPNQTAVVTVSTVVRYDTHGSFANPGSWTTFNVSAVPGAAPADAGPGVQPGYWGGGFDGRYLYLIPYALSVGPVVPDGRILRYDTGQHPVDDGGAPDAGTDGDAEAPADAGDAAAEDAGPANDGFTDAGAWESFDLTTGLTTPNPNAAGFAGAVFDGKGIYLVPFQNQAYGAEAHAGYSSTIAHLTVTGSNPPVNFKTASDWSTFDLTEVNGLDFAFVGGGFDGRYVYLAPRSQNIVPRFDTTASSVATPAAWSTYDLDRQTDAGSPQYFGVAFDGRFVYFLPFTPYQQLARYDTLSPFTADCAWSLVDLATADLDASSPVTYAGAVFDGEYLYLIPSAANGYIARFHARTPNSMPALPAFHGSFW